MRKRRRVVGLAVVLSLSVSLPSAFANPKKEKAKEALGAGITLQLPDAAALGRYEGEIRISMGEVRDRGYSETPQMLGVGPGAAYIVNIRSTHRQSVADAVDHLLQQTGLRADSRVDAEGSFLERIRQ